MALVSRQKRDQGTARRSIGEAFSPRHNSLNFLRLVFAASVIFTHASQLMNPGTEAILHKTTIGTPALYGFFTISGFLIAGSVERTKPLRYLWQRALRVFPAFWVCLLVTAFGFGLIGWFHSHAGAARSCGLSCYLREPGGPLSYVFHNSWLKLNQQGITNTLAGSKLPNLWNGSIWTLFYEFVCWIGLAALGLIGALRHRWTLVVLAASIWISLLTITAVPNLNVEFNVFHSVGVLWKSWFELVPIFLVGTLLYLYRDKIPDSGWLALGSLGLFLVGLVLPIGDKFPGYTLTSTDVTAVFFAYPVIWLGMHLPFQAVGARNDYSYGTYIYAFPIQQLLVLWGVSAWGYWPYSLLALSIALPFGVASWWAIEKHALRLKKIQLGWLAPALRPATTDDSRDAPPVQVSSRA